MRIAVAGIHIESATTNPLLSTTADFFTTRGEEMKSRYPFRNQSLFSDWQWLDLAHFRAIPGGPVCNQAWQEMTTEILDKLTSCLQQGDVDGFYLDIHGAMSVVGLEDAEAELISAIRALIGSRTPIAVSQDLHGNLSAKFVAQADVITAYRTAPHIDFIETRARACKLLHQCLHQGLPWRAWTSIPVLLSGEYTSTLQDPAKSIYQELDTTTKPELWDQSLWAGYPWADQKRAHSASFACGTNAEVVQQTCHHFAEKWWQAREQFHLVCPAKTATECLNEAWQSDLAPVFLSDSGDNPTAGGAGDIPDTLAHMLAFAPLQNPASSTPASQSLPQINSQLTSTSSTTTSKALKPEAIYASIPAESAVAQCWQAGINQAVSVEVGGKLDPNYPSLQLEGTVHSLATSTIGGKEAVLLVGKIAVILTTKRHPFHRREDFLQLGLEPLECKIVVVKIGYLEPELAAMAKQHLLILSPGAVDQNWNRFPYNKVQRPLFPLDTQFNWTPKVQLFAPGERKS